MDERVGVSEAVRRALRRDDLLTLAAQAESAIGIVRPSEALPEQGSQSKPLFDLALEKLLRLAETDPRWAFRAQAWDYAAVLVRFCDWVKPALDTAYTTEEMHRRALLELKDDDAPDTFDLDKDLMRGVLSRYHAARDLRLNGHHDAALVIVDHPPAKLFGTGAEPHVAHYYYELGANLIHLGEAARVVDPSQLWEQYWETTRAAGFSSRYRFDFIRALALWNTQPGCHAVLRWLETALGHLRHGRQAFIPAPKGISEDAAQDRGVRELSVVLSTAEYLAGLEHTPATCAWAVELASCALELTDKVRARWRVVARSRAPLAVVFERVYGDLALLADQLPGQAAAQLGLRVALSAKQTGFAARIRDGRTFSGNKLIDGILNDIIEIEADQSGLFARNDGKRVTKLKALAKKLESAVSPMLADTVFPVPKDLTELVEAVGPRHVLDYVELRDTRDEEPRLFRTLIEPGGIMSFELFDPGAGFRSHFEQILAAGAQARGRAEATESPNPPAGGSTRDLDPEDGEIVRVDIDRLDFRALAEAVLPRRLTDEILVGPDAPVTLLVSAHSWLSLLPWAALKIDDAGTRLVHRAVTAQCPVLTVLMKTPPPSVEGKALIRLVGKEEHGVDVAEERRAWGLEPVPDAGERLNECGLRSADVPKRYPGEVDQALAEFGTWQFLHIASHGGGEGFTQYLQIGGEQLSAARALSLKWPEAVLMASCHVGLVVNDNAAEPLNFVMALLTGGARCVVAGIGAIDDKGTGFLASRMVRVLRDDEMPVPLYAALRSAQLAAIETGMPERGWALLSAYVC